MPLRRALLPLLAALALGLVTCGSESDVGPSMKGSILVGGASSLTEAFTQIGADFEAANPGTNVTFTFDSSGTLSQQIIDGAPVDVFASADQGNVDKVTEADLVTGDPTVFARNQLIIVTKPGNPEGITSLADLADAGVISLCGEDVPCGTFAAQALENAGVSVPESSITRGQNAKATLTAVSEGDAVAGIVYVTDALAAGDAVDPIEIPDDDNVIATYPIVVLTESQRASVATAFAEYVASDAGKAVLAEQGFLPPS